MIISGSRSGSTLLKSLLSNSPSLAALDGEEEPYVKLSGNGYGFNSDSDGLTPNHLTPATVQSIRSSITNELTQADLRERWKWRFLLQYTYSLCKSLIANLPSMSMTQLNQSPIPDWGWLDYQGVMGHYDNAPIRSYFYRDVMYEMPPFVVPQPYRWVDTPIPDTLLLKAPYNVYRPGVWEAIYPEAEFSYIILVRNPAATINGLIAGWESRYGFHKHKMSNEVPYLNDSDHYWKFDLPPGWQDKVLYSPAPERAHFQWEQSYTWVMNRWVHKPHVWVRFEDVLTKPAETCAMICNALDLTPPAVPDQLPLLMATEQPRPYRWKVRAKQIIPLLRKPESTKLLVALGYGCQEDWV